MICPHSTGIVDALQCSNGYNETVDLSSENLGLMSAEMFESLAQLSTFRLSSATVLLPQLNRFFQFLSDHTCRLQELGK